MKYSYLFNQNQTNSKVLLEWKSPEFYPFHRGKIWYLVFHIILLLLVAAGIYTNNWAFSSLSLLVAGLYITTTLDVPSLNDFKIKEDGLEYNSKHVDFSDIRGYYFDILNENYQVLHLVPKGKYQHIFDLQFFDVSKEEINQHLQAKVQELQDVTPGLFDRLLFILKI